MTTPPHGPGDQSGADGDPAGPPSPYGQPTPYGQPGGSPYGQPAGSPYGQPGAQPTGPYGQSYPGGPSGPSGSQGTDTLSVVALVLSFTCCLSFVGAILGLVGLGRTKEGRAKGRWAAVTAIVVGLLGTLALIGGIVALVTVGTSLTTLDDLEAGTCLTADGLTDDSEENVTDIREVDCTEAHDGEVVATEVVDGEPTGCAELASAEGYDGTNVDISRMTLIPISEQVPPQDGDRVVCVAYNTDGSSLDAPLLGAAS